jgi:DNA replication protein DnaC
MLRSASQISLLAASSLVAALGRRAADQTRQWHLHAMAGNFKNTDMLVLDDWGLVGMDAQTRTVLLEMIDDRADRKATVINSQLPIEHWHEWIGDATVADAMLD